MAARGKTKKKKAAKKKMAARKAAKKKAAARKASGKRSGDAVVKLAARVLKSGKATKTEARKLAGSVLTQLGKKGKRKKGKHEKGKRKKS